MGYGEDGQKNLYSLEIGGCSSAWVSWDECVVSVGREGWEEFSRSEQSRSGAQDELAGQELLERWRVPQATAEAVTVRGAQLQCFLVGF